MKLFDMTEKEKILFKKLSLWHLTYVLLINIFFAFIYYFNFFKAHPLLKESPIFLFFAPFSTFVFIIASPWRGNWQKALKDLFKRLNNEPIFCLMGFLVFFIGFYIYSLLLWGLGALAPSLFYM